MGYEIKSTKAELQKNTGGKAEQVCVKSHTQILRLLGLHASKLSIKHLNKAGKLKPQVFSCLGTEHMDQLLVIIRFACASGIPICEMGPISP